MTINTIVFGPTGGVASYAAQYTAGKGAKVFLAMRNPGKKIPNLDESKGNFTRVQADLTDATSVYSAASTAKAHSALIYFIHGPTGTPRASIQALKDAGVKHVVFLSSFSVAGPVRSLTPEDFIAWAHARVEIDLEEVYGEGRFTAARPAYFASNLLRYAGQIKGGTVREMFPDNKFDFIAPQDIGEVVGALLLKDAGTMPRVVEICGPQMVSQRDSWTMVAKAAGRTVEVQEIGEEQALENMVKFAGIPEPVAKYLAKNQREIHDGTYTGFDSEEFARGQRNVKEYLGRDSVTLEQWIEENKDAFA